LLEAAGWLSGAFQTFQIVTWLGLLGFLEYCARSGSKTGFNIINCLVLR